MADRKISELTAKLANATDDQDVLHLVTDSESLPDNFKISIEEIRRLVSINTQTYLEAAGSITAGDVVRMINDGTVEKGVGEFTDGSEVVFESAESRYIASATLTDTKFVIVYSDQGNSGFLTYVIGEIDGLNITFGSPGVLHSTASSYIAVCKINESKFFVSYDINPNGTSVIATVSGTVATPGTPQTFNGTGICNHQSCALVSTDKVVIAYVQGAGALSRYIACTISGTVATFGTTVTYEASAATVHNVIRKLGDIDDNFFVGYIIGAAILTKVNFSSVSGTTISIGSTITIRSVNTLYVGTVALTSKIILFACEDTTSGEGRILIIRPSEDGSYNIGPEYVFSYNGPITYIQLERISDTRAVLAYRTEDDSTQAILVETLDKNLNTLKFGSAIYLSNIDAVGPSSYLHKSLIKLHKNIFVFSAADADNSNFGTSIAMELTETVGTAVENASASNNLYVVTDGKSTNHSGLTVGQFYYSDDGTLNTEGRGEYIGRAVSTTEILLDKRTWSDIK